MNKYIELVERHRKEVNEFPMMFAFNKNQFEEGMIKLGLAPEDKDKIYSIGYGGYIRKTDSKAFNELFKRQREELIAEIDKDTTGEGFIYEMFLYELNNHEYIVTMEIDDALNALELTYDEVKSSPTLTRGLKLARQKIESSPLL